MNILHENLPWLNDNTILLAKHGSHAYGLNTELSDIDLRGIFVAPKEYYFGLKKIEQVMGSKDNTEWTIFEIKKFLNLCKSCNPNILELLYIDDENLLKVNCFGEKLKEYRDKFLNKKIRYSFGGMAIHHLNRIKEHRDHILNPPKPPKDRKEYGLLEYEDIDRRKLSQCLAEIEKEVSSWNVDFGELLDYEKIKIIDQIKGMSSKWVESKLRTAGKLLNFSDSLIELLEKEKAYRNINTKYKQFLDWQKTRNPKRYALEEKIHYDPKDGSHLLRVARQATEALLTKTLKVKRVEDREELLYIKNGNMKFENLIELAEKEIKAMDKAMEISTLPKEPDHKFIDKLCIDIVEDFIDENL